MRFLLSEVNQYFFIKKRKLKLNPFKTGTKENIGNGGWRKALKKFDFNLS